MDILRTVEGKFNFFPHITHDFFWRLIVPRWPVVHILQLNLALWPTALFQHLSRVQRTRRKQTHTHTQTIRYYYVRPSQAIEKLASNLKASARDGTDRQLTPTMCAMYGRGCWLRRVPHSWGHLSVHLPSHTGLLVNRCAVFSHHH